MHTTTIPDSQGEFSSPRLIDTPCHKCTNTSIQVQTWESSCGGYEDYRFECPACGHVWWVDGIDS